jgi:hypothetical protein
VAARRWESERALLLTLRDAPLCIVRMEDLSERDRASFREHIERLLPTAPAQTASAAEAAARR